MTSYTARTSGKFLDLLLAMLTMLAGIFLNVKIAVLRKQDLGSADLLSIMR